MATINNGLIQIGSNLIPNMELEQYLNEHKEVLNEVSMKELKDLFVFGIPNNFKEFLLLKVSLYDSSSAVKSFKYSGKDYWLDKFQRNSIFNLINLLEADKIDIILGEDIYTMLLEDIKNLISKLEVYAYLCKLTTLNHLNTIKLISTPKNSLEFKEYIDLLVNYDYTTGYPEKLEL